MLCREKRHGAERQAFLGRKAGCRSLPGERRHICLMGEQNAVKKGDTARRVPIIALIGFLDSLYLLYHHTAVTGGYQRGPSFCNLGGTLNCDKVAVSPYSLLFGIPIASYGLLYYFLLIVLTRNMTRDDEKQRQSYGDALMLLAFSSLLVSVVLFALSVFAIHYVCISCSLLYAVSLALCVVAWISPRTRPAWKSMCNGVLVLLSVFFPFGPSRAGAKMTAVLLWLTLLSASVITYRLPDVLVSRYFEPREEKLLSKQVLVPVYEQWKNDPAKDIPLNPLGPPEARDFTLGRAAAKIKIIVFSDFECPYCKRAAAALESLVAEHPEDLQVVFKNYPLDRMCNSVVSKSVHEYSCLAGMLARCAGRGGNEAFWKMHDALFELGAFQWDRESLLSLPERLGMDEKAVIECLNDPAVLARVKEDVAVGNSLGILGTPSLFINGKPIQFGARDYVFEGKKVEVLLRLEHLPGLIKLILENDASGIP